MYLSHSLRTPLLTRAAEQKLAREIDCFRTAFQRKVMQEPAVVTHLVDILTRWESNLLRIDAVCNLAMNDSAKRNLFEPLIRANVVTLRKLATRLEHERSPHERRHTVRSIIRLIEELSIRQRHFESAPFKSAIADHLLTCYFDRCQRMTLANMRLVIPIAKNYCGNSPMLPDMIQEGNRGLMRAVTKFDYRRQIKFSTYATTWIKQAILAALPNANRNIRVPEHFRSLGRKVQRMIQNDCVGPVDNGRNVSRVANRLNLDVHDAAKLISIQQDTFSLDQPIDGITEQVMLRNLIADPGNNDPEFIAQVHERQELAHSMLAALEPREHDVISLRFGIADGVDRTLAEVGKVLGITRERTRQIEKVALEKLSTLPVTASDPDGN